jgi:hypothetical protein
MAQVCPGQSRVHALPGCPQLAGPSTKFLGVREVPYTGKSHKTRSPRIIRLQTHPLVDTLIYSCGWTLQRCQRSRILEVILERTPTDTFTHTLVDTYTHLHGPLDTHTHTHTYWCRNAVHFRLTHLLTIHRYGSCLETNSFVDEFSPHSGKLAFVAQRLVSAFPRTLDSSPRARSPSYQSDSSRIVHTPNHVAVFTETPDPAIPTPPQQSNDDYLHHNNDCHDDYASPSPSRASRGELLLA